VQEAEKPRGFAVTLEEASRRRRHPNVVPRLVRATWSADTTDEERGAPRRCRARAPAEPFEE
jgi:hypothetical protein